jgi:hypothetical protein
VILPDDQLLIAMLSATSAIPFKEKPIKEFDELPPEGRLIYATICVASAFRFSLQKTEIVMASGVTTNDALNTLNALIRRHIVVLHPDGSVRARHRMIAELVLDELQKDGQLRPILQGLAILAATQVNQAGSRTSNAWRLLKQMLNHDFLARSLEIWEAQLLFTDLEDLLSWDYHYWLQRGSLEVEAGSIVLAEHFLSQARSLEPSDVFVQTEWAYLLFRKAILSPASPSSIGLMDEASKTLEGMIENHKFNARYAGHILGSQGLAWARRGIPTASERSAYLQKLIVKLKSIDATGDPELIAVVESLQREQLLTAVSSFEAPH